MFVTEGISRFEHQFDPLLTRWSSVELEARSKLFVARTAEHRSGAARNLLISSADALSDAIVGKCFGTVQQICVVGGLDEADLREWQLHPIAQVRRHFVDILGGVEVLEAVLQTGQRLWISPPLSGRIRKPGEIIWECSEAGAVLGRPPT